MNFVVSNSKLDAVLFVRATISVSLHRPMHVCKDRAIWKRLEAMTGLIIFIRISRVSDVQARLVRQGKGIRLVQTAEQLRQAMDEMPVTEVVMSRCASPSGSKSWSL